MKLARAEKLAEKVRDAFFDYWQISTYAGSIRRKKPHVKDIELIFVPNVSKPHLDIAQRLLFLQGKHKVKILKNGEKYKQFWLTKKNGEEIIKVDIFIVTPPAQFGVIYTIRTGSVAFSKWLVNCRKDKGFQFRKGALYREDKLIKTSSELEVFEALQLEFVPPEKRELTKLDFNTLKIEFEE